MDIHKPKSIHNWREFLKEYAIIVLGVATALAAEQAVEWLRDRSKATEARASIREEIAHNLGWMDRRHPMIDATKVLIRIMMSAFGAKRTLTIGRSRYL